MTSHGYMLYISAGLLLRWACNAFAFVGPGLAECLLSNGHFMSCQRCWRRGVKHVRQKQTSAEFNAAHAGPIAPVLMTAWTVAFVTSLSHFPYTVEGRQW